MDKCVIVEDALFYDDCYDEVPDFYGDFLEGLIEYGIRIQTNLWTHKSRFTYYNGKPGPWFATKGLDIWGLRDKVMGYLVGVAYLDPNFRCENG